MAQTKTKRAKGSSKTRASGNGAKAKAAPKPKATKRPPRPRRSGNGSKATSHNGAAHVASKAKVPLLAGGAALVGTVGGVVIGSTHSGDKVLGISLPKRRRPRISSKDLARAAREVGRFGDSVGELGAELRRVRQGLANDDERQSSPLEVLLKGLTTRR